MAFLIQALAIGLIPFLGGLPGAAAASLVAGGGNGLGNVLFITSLQRWTPARLLGRVTSLVMLAAFGSFPLSAAVGGLLVHGLGPAPLFPIASVTIAAPVLAGLTRREFRAFGAPSREPQAGTWCQAPGPGPAV